MSVDLKVCPDCGACPNPEDDGQQAPFCQYCGTKLVGRSELPRDIWKDPSVKEALKGGRAASDIAVIACPECNQYGYYNEGTTFSCRFCDLTFYVLSEDEEAEGRRTVSADEVIRLDDTITNPTDGYNNQTRPG